MTIKLYWWNLRRSPRSLAAEILHAPQAWSRAALETRQLFLNFGDAMSRDIVESVFGQRVVWSSEQNAELVAVGSVLQRMEKGGRPLTVWGTGLRSAEPADAAVDREFRYLAVRGHRTAERLGLDGQLPLGDPGILADEVFGHGPASRNAVYIPHFSELAQWSRLRQFSDELGTGLVLPTAEPKKVVREISSADVVYSSSLHGIIVADSYGIPVIPLIPFSGAENPFKYSDYMGVIGNESPLRSHADLLSASPAAKESLLQGAAAEADARRQQIAATKEALLSAARKY